MKRIVELIKRINFCGYLIIAIVLSLPVAVVYAESVPYSFMPGEVISASEHNENFNYLAERSWGLSGTDLYYNDGNVSIGAIDPIRADRRLHIYDVDNPQLRLEKATGYVDLWGGENFHIITGTDHRFFVSGVNGNVGIGTNSPQQKLDVEGYVEAYGYYTGDIIFQKDGQTLWRMFEEKDGLYLENLKTGTASKVFLEEDIAILKKELVEELRKEIIAELKAGFNEKQ